MWPQIDNISIRNIAEIRINCLKLHVYFQSRIWRSVLQDFSSTPLQAFWIRISHFSFFVNLTLLKRIVNSNYINASFWRETSDIKIGQASKYEGLPVHGHLWLLCGAPEDLECLSMRSNVYLRKFRMFVLHFVCSRENIFADR